VPAGEARHVVERFVSLVGDELTERLAVASDDALAQSGATLALLRRALEEHQRTAP
jgi:hypothetical protein